eukprot:1713842-Amphidinium_carterae.1
MGQVPVTEPNGNRIQYTQAPEDLSQNGYSNNPKKNQTVTPIFHVMTADTVLVHKRQEFIASPAFLWSRATNALR